VSTEEQQDMYTDNIQSQDTECPANKFNARSYGPLLDPLCLQISRQDTFKAKNNDFTHQYLFSDEFEEQIAM
jgi:hypothetical protein